MTLLPPTVNGCMTTYVCPLTMMLRITVYDAAAVNRCMTAPPVAVWPSPKFHRNVWIAHLKS